MLPPFSGLKCYIGWFQVTLGRTVSSRSCLGAVPASGIENGKGVRKRARAGSLGNAGRETTLVRGIFVLGWSNERVPSCPGLRDRME
jgi:hypothetical protein